MPTPPTGNPRGQPSKYKPEYCEMLIEHMKAGKSFESFGAVLGTHWDTLYEWVKVHADFSEAKKIGKNYELQFWENIATHASIGAPLNIKGMPGKMNNPNPTLIIFSMKNKFPKMYRDQIKLDADINITDKTFSELANNEKATILKAALDAKLKTLESNDDEGK